MKKIFFLILIVVIHNTATAQNVGIGTTTPASKLHLVGNLLQENGTITLNNAASIIQLQNLGVNKTYLQLSGDNLRLGTNGGNQFGKIIIRMAGADRVLIDSTGNTQILGLQDASLTSDGYITLGSVTDRNMVLDNNEIIVRSNGGVDNLILQNDGGNVGIGTGSPTQRLDVNGNIRSSAGILADGDMIINNTGATLQLRNGSNVNKGFFQLSGDNVRIGTNSGNSTGNLIIRMNANDRVTINPAGDIDLDGKITRSAATGTVNLLPKCFGTVASDGTIISGSGNFTVSKGITGNYNISFTGYSASNTVFIGTCFSGFGNAGGLTLNGNLFSNNILVITKEIDGTYRDASFSFIIYQGN
jgi:hypothetical protein